MFCGRYRTEVNAHPALLRARRMVLMHLGHVPMPARWVPEVRVAVVTFVWGGTRAIS